MRIEVTEYVRPYGDSSTGTVEIPDAPANVVENYNLIKQYGMRITVEGLDIGNLAAVCLEDPEFGDFDTDLAQAHEAAVTEKIVEMLSRFSSRAYHRWSRNMIESEQA